MRTPKQSQAVSRGLSTSHNGATGIAPADCNCGQAGVVSNGGECCLAGRAFLCQGTQLSNTNRSCDFSFADRRW